jgi:hypothetical protein
MTTDWLAGWPGSVRRVLPATVNLRERSASSGERACGMHEEPDDGDEHG